MLTLSECLNDQGKENESSKHHIELVEAGEDSSLNP
jgi:hypothetical protein